MVLHVELDEAERSVYDAVRVATKQERRREARAGGGGVLAALEALLRLRQAACHSALVPGQQAETSSKIERLLEALEDAVAEGHKALVFSQWTSLLDLVEPHLRDGRHPLHAPRRLDARSRRRRRRVPGRRRARRCMLVSLKAGGTGLNLTAADHVFLLDPWWNPAVEDQAADRAHRIGQERPVMVYRMVAKDTVEERILALQEQQAAHRRRRARETRARRGGSRARSCWRCSTDGAYARPSSMFRHQGPARSERDNRILAGYLAFIGGFVNSAGFVLVGSFTSHVTGNVGRLANDVGAGDLRAAVAALTMIGAFTLGAFVASMCIESHVFGKTPYAYGAALSCEAGLLVLFGIASTVAVSAHPRLNDMQAMLLCAAMGMQNSLVTRLSGAVVRTTHLTGVFTDIGIEGARWFRWWRGRMSVVLGVRFSFGDDAPERPSPVKIGLLSTIAAAFTTGAVCGCMTAIALRQAAMILPTLAVGIAATYAFVSGRRDEGPLSGHGRAAQDR